MLIEVAPGDKEWVGFKVEDLETDEVISTATWVAPAPLNVLSTVKHDTEVSVLLSGFVLGARYRVTCEIVTTRGGREINRYLDIVVVDMTGSELV